MFSKGVNRMSIHFIRHGETVLNAARVIQPADTPLGPRGLEQAELAAQRIKSLKPAAILSSDMPRAWQTAQAISKATGLTPQTTTLLWERNFGDFRGKPHNAFDFDPINMEDAPPNGESLATFHARVDRALEYAIALHATLNGPLIVVSHGLVIHSLFQRRVDLNGHTLPQRISNTAVSTIDPTKPHRAILVNCTLHLSGTPLADDAKSLSGG
jgi:probable phosphoglycerate mutase